MQAASFEITNVLDHNGGSACRATLHVQPESLYDGASRKHPIDPQPDELSRRASTSNDYELRSVVRAWAERRGGGLASVDNTNRQCRKRHRRSQ